MRTITLLLLCVIIHSANAQDFVIGGQAKPSINSVKYDSLSNFFTLYANQAPEKAKEMIGQDFTYYNINDYSSGIFVIPYPWKDGRLRSGRYTSSQTAKNLYFADLKKKSGTKYRLTDYVVYEGKPGYVFSDSKGESFFYPIHVSIDGEFICEGYKEKFRKTYVGKEVYYTRKGSRTSTLNPQHIEYNFIGLQSRQLVEELPYMSKWVIKGIGVDTTYWGNRTQNNDIKNNFCRLVFVIHNDTLGDYECWVHTSGMLNRVKSSNPLFVLVDSLLNKPYPWGEEINTFKWGSSIPDDILMTAKKGNPSAMYAIIDFYNRNSRFGPISNFTYDDFISFLEKAVDNGYIHNRTSRWFREVATHFIPYMVTEKNNPNIIWDKFDNKNNYEKGIPFLIKSARLGNNNAFEDLVKCYESGKTKDSNVYKLIEEKANDNHYARLFFGRRLLRGEIVPDSKQVLSWLQQTANNTNNNHKNEAVEASLILSECFKQGIGVQIKSNKSLEYLIKSANNNNKNACFELGVKYYVGKDVEKNWEKAEQYLKKGVMAGSSEDDFEYSIMLGKILESKSNNSCIYYFESAIPFLLSGDTKRYEAAMELGNIYYEGKIVEKDEGKAAEYYWLAYKYGKLMEGKRLFEKYQLKDKLINYLNEQKSEGKLTANYVDEIIQSLNK